MSTTSDMRRWAQRHNIPVPDTGPVPGEVRERWERRHDDDGQAAAAELDGEGTAADAMVAWHSRQNPSEWENSSEAPLSNMDDPDDPAFTVSLPSGGAFDGLRAPQSPVPPPAGQSPARPAERKPVPPPRKRRGLFGSKLQQGGKPPAKRRVSIENVVSGGWGLAALALMRSPQSVPVGRVLQMQAPVAGIIVEDVAKGTIVDEILQPFARTGEAGEKYLALAGPPLLVAIMTNQPELYPVLRPVLKMAMMSWLEVSGPAMKKAQKRAERLLEDYGDIDLDAMLDAIWAPAEGGAAPSEDEEAAIRRAKGA